jgi:hypothetical protein
MNFPSWLPELFNVNPWSDRTYELLYEIFHTNFVASKASHNGTPVLVSQTKEEGKEITFWHITTREDKECEQRLPDHRRCERLPWLKPMLEDSDKPDVLAWEHTEGDGVIKVYVWLKEHDYIAIMKKTSKGRLILLTAYWIEYGNIKRKLMKKYEARNKEANA